jgi:hypothetical protein
MFRALAGRTVHSLLLRFVYVFSTHRRIEGIWVGAFSGKFEEQALLDRVSAALYLMAETDPRRYQKVRRYLGRVLIGALPGRLAHYVHKWRLCQLDDSFVMDLATTGGEIASTIIHEATHARIRQRGIRYQVDRRREEHICLGEERVFLSSLPDSARAVERLEHLRSKDTLFWEQSGDRTRAASAKALADLGLPQWLIRALLFFWTGERAA